MPREVSSFEARSKKREREANTNVSLRETREILRKLTLMDLVPTECDSAGFGGGDGILTLVRVKWVSDP